MESWIMLVQQVLLMVITAMVPVLTAVVVSYLNKKGIMDALKEKRMLVEKGVAFVEQAYSDLGGAEKYGLALEWIVDRLNDLKIPYSMAELEGLIEAAVNGINSVWIFEFEDDEF
jgi:LL-H family phage holin